MTALSLGGGPTATASTSLEAEMEFRARFGLTADLAAVLEAHRDASADTSFGLPLTKAEARALVRRGRIAPALGPLRAFVEARRSRFAGLYVDNRSGGQVVIQVAGRAGGETQRATRKLLPRWIDIRYERVANSAAELDSVVSLLRGMASERDARVRGLASIAVVGVENVVEVRVIPERLDAVRDLLATYVDSGPAVVIPGEYDQNTACNSRTDCWQDPLRGGLRVTPDGCTTGFMVYNDGYARRLLTAGHCTWDDNESLRYHAGNSLGKVLKNSYWDGSGSDFAALSIADAQDMSGHKIYKSDSDKAWNIADWAVPAVNDTVRMTGSFGGLSSYGQIDSVQYDSYRASDDVWLYDMVRADYSWSDGDSGAPVFYDNVAYGIQSGCTDGCNDPGDRAVFSSLGKLYNARHGSSSGDKFEMTVCTSTDGVQVC
jgi:hypothetical protein